MNIQRKVIYRGAQGNRHIFSTNTKDYIISSYEVGLFFKEEDLIEIMKRYIGKSFILLEYYNEDKLYAKNGKDRGTFDIYSGRTDEIVGYIDTVVLPSKYNGIEIQSSPKYRILEKV